MEGKNTKTTYACPVCGKKYNNVLLRNRCEIKCRSNKSEIKNETKNETKNEAYANAQNTNAPKINHAITKRRAEVDAAYEKYIKLKEKFEKDFGCPYETTHTMIPSTGGAQLF